MKIRKKIKIRTTSARHIYLKILCGSECFVIVITYVSCINYVSYIEHVNFNCVGRSKLVGERPMKSLLSACPTVRLSICPSVCLSIRPLVNLPVCLSVRPSLSFLKIRWLVFFWYCTWWKLTLISSDWRSQIFEKKLAAQIWAQQAEIRSKIRFLVILLSFDYMFSLKLHTLKLKLLSLAWDNV